MAGHLETSVPAGPILVVTDAFLVTQPSIVDALAQLRRSGIAVTVFDRVEPDPSRATLEAAVMAGREAGVVGVVGIGGGSPMDVAKLAAYLLGSDHELDMIWGVDRATGARLPLVLVPTTAGTGSEATPVSIITMPNGEKRGASSRAFIADVAVLDPHLTRGLPQPVTAATGLDAMVHAIEAYTSLQRKNPFSDMMAREALGLLAANLLKATEFPDDMAARGAMLLGAHLAGLAFANAPVGGVHALAYPLGGRFHVPHGLSNVLMLPHVLAFNMPVAMQEYAELAPLIDPDLRGLGAQAKAAGLVEALTKIARECGMPHRLREVGVCSADLDLLAADAMLQDRLLRNNPRAISLGDARRLYEAAL